MFGSLGRKNLCPKGLPHPRVNLIPLHTVFTSLTRSRKADTTDRGSYFIPQKTTTSEFVYPKKSLLFLTYPKKSLRLCFRNPKKSLRFILRDPKKSLRTPPPPPPPPSLKYVSGAPGYVPVWCFGYFEVELLIYRHPASSLYI